MTTVAPTTNTSASTSSSSTSSSLDQLSGNFQTFLSLLTTQLKIRTRRHRWIPTHSRSNWSMYSQVEQQIDTNTKLDSLISLGQTQSNSLRHELPRQECRAHQRRRGPLKWSGQLDLWAEQQRRIDDAHRYQFQRQYGLFRQWRNRGRHSRVQLGWKGQQRQPARGRHVYAHRSRHGPKRIERDDVRRQQAAR